MKFNINDFLAGMSDFDFLKIGELLKNFILHNEVPPRYIIMETHPDPVMAKSDGKNSMPMNLMYTLLETLKKIDAVTKNNDLLEDSIND